jgi:multidrug efflux pump subunit AcrA (membrane-fusion protein)
MSLNGIAAGIARWFIGAALIAACAVLSPMVSAQPAPPAVLVAAAQMRDVSSTAEFVGRVKAIDKVDLRARFRLSGPAPVHGTR